MLPPLLHGGWIWTVAFSLDGKNIVTVCGDQSARIWDAATGYPIGPPLRHPRAVHAVTFSPDGKNVLTGWTNGGARLYSKAPDVPDDLDRVANWVEVLTGLRLDRQQGSIQLLDNAAWLASRERLEQSGGPPVEDSLETAAGWSRGLEGALSQSRTQYAKDKLYQARSLHNGQPAAAAVLCREAKRVLERAILVPPNHGDRIQLVSCFDMLAFSLAQAGKSDEAIAANQQGQLIAERLIADFPTEPGYLRTLAVGQNNLAWLLATCADAKLREPGRAVEMAKRAVTLAPKEGIYWNTLGVAHYRAGDWKAAIEALSKSMELRKGGDSNDWFFLAMAHWQLGDKPQARSWYDKAVTWMDKNQTKDEELIRFRTEAEALLGVNKKKD
jgi:tetratricopeptide (TPR) repeat protein